MLPAAREPVMANGLRAVKVLLFANTDWYLYNFRLPLAQAPRGYELFDRREATKVVLET